jgi:hypothetical protein
MYHAINMPRTAISRAIKVQTRAIPTYGLGLVTTSMSTFASITVFEQLVLSSVSFAVDVPSWFN